MKKYNTKYWAKRSSQYNQTNWVKNEKLIDVFLNMLPQKAFNNILEIGIGTGAVAEVVAKKIGPLIGIDISKEMIDKINNPLISNCVGDAHNLDFEVNWFDLIYMRNVIHYIESPEIVFSEIYKCLKPGGYFLFSQVIPPSDLISNEYDWLIGRDIHYPTKNEIFNWLNLFSVKGDNEFILKRQSIMNWLNNTCEDQFKKEQILDRHRCSSDKYKSLVNYYEDKNDILVDIKHLMILLKKD
tara:strand:+ start:424 stop:1146 length:723 start_codon:yes stop_codon:yes gene_type:complete